MPSLGEAGKLLRNAVKSGSYAEAECCLLAYTEGVNAVLAEADPRDQRCTEAVSAALDLLRWADRAVRAGRAHTLGELARLSAGRPYHARPPAPASKIQLLG